MNRAQRVSSAGSLRNAPAGSENVMMQSRIQQLEQQVITVQAEYRQVTERLNCLMLLVKRSATVNDHDKKNLTALNNI